MDKVKDVTIVKLMNKLIDEVAILPEDAPLDYIDQLSASGVDVYLSTLDIDVYDIMVLIAKVESYLKINIPIAEEVLPMVQTVGDLVMLACGINPGEPPAALCETCGNFMCTCKSKSGSDKPKEAKKPCAKCDDTCTCDGGIEAPTGDDEDKPKKATKKKDK